MVTTWSAAAAEAAAAAAADLSGGGGWSGAGAQSARARGREVLEVDHGFDRTMTLEVDHLAIMMKMVEMARSQLRLLEAR
jgi:hypothetical protein